jgi:hypothetical protein
MIDSNVRTLGGAMSTRIIARTGAAVVAVVLLLALTGTVAHGSPGADERTDAPAIADAIRFRQDLGLRADVEYVRQAAIDADSFPDSPWGVPLSLAEQEELARRIEVQDALGPGVELAETSDAYSGMYIDQMDEGTPVFTFTEIPSQLMAEISSSLPPGTRVRAELRPYTRDGLLEVVGKIERDYETLGAAGIQVTALGVDEVHGVVLVGLADPTDAATERLTATYGDALRFRSLQPGRADACNSLADCWPPKGGMKIVSNSGGGICTSAFVARRTDTGELALVTAGHCIATWGGSEIQWTHGGNVIGKSKQYVWQSFTNADVGLIRINDDATADMAGNYRRYISDNSPITVSSMTGVGSTQQPGFQVCRMGWTSKLDCGTILYTGVARYSCVGTDCRLINNTNEVSFDSTGGDSGGSVFSALSTIGYGLHVHSDDDNAPDPHGWYSPLNQARSTLISVKGVTINWCVTATC